MKRRILRSCAPSLVVVGGFALLSWVTTFYSYTAGYPPCEIQIRVVDSMGKPIQGAHLETQFVLNQSSTGEHIPIFEREPGLSSLVSDRDGLIVACSLTVVPCGGGTHWDLFWMIPIEAPPPKIMCEIRAEGYVPLRVPLDEFLKPKPIDTKSGSSVKRQFGNGSWRHVELFRRKVVLRSR